MVNLLRTKKSLFSKTVIMLFFLLLTSAMAWADQTPVSYVDANGQTHFVTEYTEVTSSMSPYWSKGTYVVKGDVDINHRIVLNGDVNLILTDGCKMTVTTTTDAWYDYAIESFYAEVKIADGQVLSDGTNIYTGTLTDDEVNAIGAQPLYVVTGVALAKDGSNVTATFDGTSLNTLSIPVDVNVNSIALNRTFSENKCATIMLPFGKDVSQIEGGKFYAFGGVEQNGDKWEATMNEVVGSIEANTPYLVMPSATSLTFTGGATLNIAGGGNQQTAKTDSHWTFKGTYAYKEWIADGANADEIGSVYGFAGVQKSDVEVGDFVCVASGAKIRPMGCYLIWNDEPNEASARRMAPASEEMPQRIAVRLVSANGVTTAIGELDTKTDEFSFNDWFSLDGSKLSGKPTEKGVYINNGKKVVIK